MAHSHGRPLHFFEEGDVSLAQLLFATIVFVLAALFVVPWAQDQAGLIVSELFNP